MTTYAVNKKLDYVTFSAINYEPIDDSLGKAQATHPRQRNYNAAIEYDCGLIVQWHTARPLMKHSISASGQTLTNLRHLGFSDSDLLVWAFGLKKAKFSRIDVCVTSERIDGGVHGFLPQKAHYYATNGMIQSRLKVDKPVTNENLEVETCYIGSRKARNRLIRVYDKGIELGSRANRIIRIEMQTNKGANNMAKRVFRGQDIGGIIRSYIDFPHDETWLEIMESEASANYRTKYDTPKHLIEAEANDNRWNWLVSSVAPALAKAMLYDDTHQVPTDNQKMFTNMVAYHYHKLSESQDI